MRALAFGLAAALLPFVAQAETPLFAEDGELAITIEAPLRELARRAPDSTDPYPATLTVTGDAPQSFPIELSARGLSRRTRGFCDFPPLRLDFDGDALDGTVFDGQNRLKLVTHCKPTERYEQLVVTEMLVYSLYNEITDASFRARPVRVTYRYSDRNGREEIHFGFLLEDVDDLAERNGMVALDLGSQEIASSQLDPAAAARYALFEFMIGNLDWDLTAGPDPDECCHNTRLMAADETTRIAVVPAPYDFDHSGFVNAPYATPPEQVPVNSVRARYYWGLCRHNDALPAAVAEFQAKRPALLAAIQAETRLSASRRESAVDYIEGFFEILEDPNKFDRQVIRRCRG